MYDYDGPTGGITDEHVAMFLDGVASKISSLMAPVTGAGCAAPCQVANVCARDGTQRLGDAEEEWRMLPPTMPQPSAAKRRAQEEAVQRAISGITSPKPEDGSGNVLS